MKLLLNIIFLSSVCLLSSGCVAGWIISGGTHYQALQNPKTHLDKVRSKLGEPYLHFDYDQPTPIEQTREMIVWRQSSLGFRRLEYEGEGPLASMCEVYRIKGLLADPLRSQGHFMVVGMTFGLAEIFDPFSIPSSIKYRRENSDRVSWLLFWYDDRGFYVESLYPDRISSDYIAEISNPSKP